MSALNTLVLRSAKPDGDFVFRVAKVSEEQAGQIEQDFAGNAVQPEVFERFGPPLSLADAMQNIETRDFSVLDVG